MNIALKPSNITDDLQVFFNSSNMVRTIIILISASLIAYFVSKYLARAIVKLAQIVSSHTDKETNDQKYIRLRQIETYLSVAVAIVRAIVVSIVIYITWFLLTRGKFSTSSGLATIGASAFFIVFAGQSLGMLLRDLTAGATMIIEQWFNVGDHIKVEPFMDAKGVVERFTLRSTKLRSLSGEILWIHNQYIQGVHVTPYGVRTMIVDVFVKDLALGEETIKEIIGAVPSGPALLTKPLRIISKDRWNDDMWRISIIGYTAPGREWLIERFFVNAIKEVDEGVESKGKRIFVYEPIARFADPIADKKFLRSVRSGRRN